MACPAESFLGGVLSKTVHEATVVDKCFLVCIYHVHVRLHLLSNCRLTYNNNTSSLTPETPVAVFSQYQYDQNVWHRWLTLAAGADGRATNGRWDTHNLPFFGWRTLLRHSIFIKTLHLTQLGTPTAHPSPDLFIKLAQEHASRA